MDKRYKFIVGGKTYFKNVSPDNQQKFFNLYEKYNPVLVPNEPSKSIQETDQSQQNQKKNKKGKIAKGIIGSAARTMLGPGLGNVTLSKIFSETKIAKASSVVSKGIKNENQKEELKKYLSNSADNISPLFEKSFLTTLANVKKLFNVPIITTTGLRYQPDIKTREEGRDKTDEKIVDLLNQAGEIKFKDTGPGVVAGIEEGNAAAILGGLFNNITSTVSQVIPAMVSNYLVPGSGVGVIATQLYGPAYYDFNKERAIARYGENDPDALKKLFANGEDKLIEPMINATAQVGLEYIGFKGIDDAIKMVPGARSSLGKIAIAGGKEGFTEWGQYGLETINTSRGQGDSALESTGKGINSMFSKQGLEMWIAGFTGGGFVSGAGRTINAALRSDKNSQKKFNDYVDTLYDLKTKKLLTKDEDLQDAFDIEIKKVENNFKDFLNNTTNLSQFLTKDQETDLTNTLEERNNITDKIQKLKTKLDNNVISQGQYNEAVSALEGANQTLDENLKFIKKQALEAASKRQVETVRKQIEDEGLEGEVIEATADEISKMDLNKTDAKKAAGEYGFIKQFKDGSFEIIINTDKPALGTAAHEFLHAVLYKTLGNDNNVSKELSSELIDHVSKLKGKGVENLLKKLQSYEGDPDFNEEIITVMSESIIDGSLEFNDGFFTRIGDILRRFFARRGKIEYKFDTGRDVYNFIKDFNESVKTGKVNKAIIKVAKEGAKGKLVDKAKTRTDADIEADRIKFSRDAKPQVDELGKMGWTSETWKTQGSDFAISEMKQNNMLDRLIASKLKVPMSVDKTKEFVSKVYAELTSHAKNFNPEVNDSFFGWINSQIANKAGNVYNREYKVEQRTQDIDARTEEGAPAIQVEADITAEQDFIDRIGLTEEQQVEYSKLRRRLKLDDSIMNKVRDAVIKTFGTKLPDVESKKFRNELEKRYRTELKKPIQDMIGTRENYTKFLKNNFESVYNALPVETLVQMERNLKPENRIFTTSKRITKPTEVDRLISEGRLPKDTNRTSGPQLHNKNKYPGEEKVLAFFRGTDMKNKLGYEVGGSTLGTRKDKLAMEISVELGFDATSETIQQPEVQEKRKGILSLQGQEQAKNELAIIAKQVNRDPSIKFSRSIDQGAQFYKDGLDLVNAIAAKGDLGGIVNMKSLKEGKYVGLDKYKNIPSSTIKYVINEIYLKDKQFLNTGKLLNKLSKGIKAGDARAKGFEQFVINRFGKIDGVKLIFEKQSEEGVDIPDVYGTLYGQPFNVEVKLFDAQVSSLTINDVNVSKGSVVIKKLDNLSQKNIDKVNKLVNKTIPVFKDIKKRLKGLTKDPNATKKDIEVLNKWNSPKDLMPNWAHKVLKSEGYFKRLTQIGVFDQSLIEELYLNKAIPTNYIYMLGKGFFHLKNDVLNINSPKLEGTFLAPIRQVKASQYKTINGVRSKTGYVTMNMRLLPTVGEVTSKSNMDIIDDIDTKNFIDNNTKSILEGKQKLNKANNLRKAHNNTIKFSKSGEAKGMSTFDFDETVGVSENFVIAKKGKDIKRIASNEWPFVGEQLANDGYTFDFSDFNKVTKGKPGPLFQKMKNQIKKYGPENVFILTARAPQSEKAIHDWLASNDINIPRKNVTGLGNSTGEAKADWMLQKFAEGYNDMYFVDDALPNVKAVKNVLEQLDIKSKVVQAKIKFSKSAPLDLNKILEETKGINADRKFTASEAMREGARNNKFKFFVPPSAEDFKGLLYAFLGKGRKGDAHMRFFKETLLDPYAKGYREWNNYKQAMSDDYALLKDKFKNVGKKLKNKVRGTSFDNEAAIRVYLWNKAGFEIPGINEEIQNKLVEQVENNPELKAFAEALSVTTRIEEGYVKPNEFWAIESIANDLNNIVSNIGRKDFLAEWINNKEIVFSPENMNKIEAIYGTGFRDALENMLYRMETGSNRTTGKDKTVNRFLDWINGSVGVTMFVNIRSAALQTISTVNFINASDNNIFRAAAAFANQPQFWKDFAFIFNSPMLKQRRAGLQIDVSASELTKVFADGKNKPQAVIAWLLEKGFAPTKIADSFAISAGGATFYRNRIKKYIKEGMSETKAKEQAFLDFQEIAEETQQSSRPDLISMQQAGPMGRIVLAWQNTPMQMTRLTKKSLSDLINRRRIEGLTQFESDKANMSRIMYYGIIQNLIFGALQTGLAFLMFGWDEDEERKKKLELRVANGALDTILRGTGVYGAAVSTLKNTLMKWREESQKGWKRDDLNIALEAISLSPPIGSKIRKIISATRTEKYNKGVSEEIGFRIENPNLSIAANWTEALLNIPVARVVRKANNVEEAITGNHDIWQRVALASGWNRWDIGVKDEELEEAKQAVKDKKKKKKQTTTKKVRCVRIKSNGQRCKNKTDKKNKRCYAHQ